MVQPFCESDNRPVQSVNFQIGQFPNYEYNLAQFKHIIIGKYLMKEGGYLTDIPMSQGAFAKAVSYYQKSTE